MPLALPQGKKSILLPKFGNTERKSHSMSNADGIVGFSGSFLIANSSYWYIPSNHLWLSVCTWKRNAKALVKGACEGTLKKRFYWHQWFSAPPFYFWAAFNLSWRFPSKYNGNEHLRRYSWSPWGSQFWMKSVLENKGLERRCLSRNLLFWWSHFQLHVGLRVSPWWYWEMFSLIWTLSRRF